MASARQFYLESIILKRKEEEFEYSSDELKDKIDSILSSPNLVVDVDAIRAEEANLEPEDDEDWMVIDPKELDDALEKYRRKEGIVKKDEKDGNKMKRGRRKDLEEEEEEKEEGESFDLGQVSKTIKQFVQHVSEFDGAEFPDPDRQSDFHQPLDSDDSSDEEDCVTSKPPLSTSISSKLPASFSNDYSDMPSDDFDFEVDSFSKALEAMMSKAKGATANQSSSGIATDDEHSSQDSDDEDDDIVNEFLTDYDDDDNDEGIGSIKNYMREMDRELSKTEMGKSFIRKSTGAPRDEADKAASKSGAAAPAAAMSSDPADAKESVEEEDECLDAPLDIDLTIVQNILESFSTRPGFAGPATNILNSMGISLPDPERP